jgi:hypothetical protein
MLSNGAYELLNTLSCFTHSTAQCQACFFYHCRPCNSASLRVVTRSPPGA